MESEILLAARKEFQRIQGLGLRSVSLPVVTKAIESSDEPEFLHISFCDTMPNGVYKVIKR